jgi:hypothetical protein
MSFCLGTSVRWKDKQLVRFTQPLELGGQCSAGTEIIIILCLNQENWNGGLPYSPDHPVPKAERPPAHRATREVDSGAKSQFLLCICFNCKDGLNAAVGATGYGDFPSIDRRQLLKVRKSCQRIFEMRFVQRNASRRPLRVERFYI